MSKGLLIETLDFLAPAQEDVPTWDEILARAGVDNPAPAQRPLWRRYWVIALAVLTAVLVPLAAIGSEQGWLWLMDGKLPPGEAHPVSDIIKLQSGYWEGEHWRTAAYRAFPHLYRPDGPTTESVCLILEFAPFSPGVASCAALPNTHYPPKTSGADWPMSPSIELVGGNPWAVEHDSQNDVMAGPGTGYLIGMTTSNVKKVEIHFKDGRVMDTSTFASPEALGVRVNFFVRPLSTWVLSLHMTKLLGLDAEGKTVACLAWRPESWVQGRATSPTICN